MPLPNLRSSAVCAVDLRSAAAQQLDLTHLVPMRRDAGPQLDCARDRTRSPMPGQVDLAVQAACRFDSTGSWFRTGRERKSVRGRWSALFSMSIADPLATLLAEAIFQAARFSMQGITLFSPVAISCALSLHFSRSTIRLQISTLPARLPYICLLSTRHVDAYVQLFRSR